MDNERKRHPQPVDVANDPNALLRMETVCAITGLSRTSIYLLMRQGLFPLPIKLKNLRGQRWRAAEIAEWNRQQQAA